MSINQSAPREPGRRFGGGCTRREPIREESVNGGELGVRDSLSKREVRRYDSAALLNTVLSGLNYD